MFIFLLVLTPLFNFAAQSTVTVDASAAYVLIPDQITIIAMIDAFDDELEKAEEKLISKKEALLKSLKQFDIKQVGEDHLLSKGIYRKNYPDTKPSLLGYKSFTRITLEFSDYSLVGPVVKLLSKKGVVNINNIMIGLSNDKKKKYYRLCRRKAMEIAKEKASELSKNTGNIIGKVVSIREYQNYTPQHVFVGMQPIYNDYDQLYKQNFYYQTGFDFLQREEDPKLTPKQTILSVKVTVSYEMADK